MISGLDCRHSKPVPIVLDSRFLQKQSEFNSTLTSCLLEPEKTLFWAKIERRFVTALIFSTAPFVRSYMHFDAKNMFFFYILFHINAEICFKCFLLTHYIDALSLLLYFQFLFCVKLLTFWVKHRVSFFLFLDIAMSTCFLNAFF